MENIDPKQIDMFDNLGDKQDSKGRTRKDIEKASKSLIKEVLESITFVDGEYYIQGIPADEWIENDRDLHDTKGDWYR